MLPSGQLRDRLVQYVRTNSHSEGTRTERGPVSGDGSDGSAEAVHVGWTQWPLVVAILLGGVERDLAPARTLNQRLGGCLFGNPNKIGISISRKL
jgi:hypothetical protein